MRYMYRKGESRRQNRINSCCQNALISTLHTCRLSSEQIPQHAGMKMIAPQKFLKSEISIPATLPETNSHFAPENRPKPNRKGSDSEFRPSIFRRELLVPGRVRTGWNWRLNHCNHCLIIQDVHPQTHQDYHTRHRKPKKYAKGPPALQQANAAMIQEICKLAAQW